MKFQLSIKSVTFPKIFNFFILFYLFSCCCSAGDLNCTCFVSLVNEIIKNNSRDKGYHVKVMVCPKLINNTKKTCKTAYFLKITEILNTVNACIIGTPIREAQATLRKSPTLKFSSKLAFK